jgi:hypothetical protein
MSFRVETTPNHYTDYQIFPVARFNELGQQLLSLINPNYETTPNGKEVTTTPNEKEVTTTPNENEGTTPNENEGTTPNENEVTTPNENKVTTPNKNEVTPQNMITQPSDLCRARAEQSPYYLTNQNVIKQIEENFIPHQSLLPYTPPSTNTIDKDEQLTTSIPNWQITKQSTESTRYLLSQIVTIIQCRSTSSTSSFSLLSQRRTRHAVRLFINSQQQQQQQMDTFLDIINEALLLEPDTMKTLWDTKGEQVRTILIFNS